MQWRNRLLQVAIILFVLLLMNLIIQYSSAQGNLKEVVSALSWALPILLLALGLAALWLAYTRRQAPQVRIQRSGFSGNTGLFLLGLIVIILALVFLLQSILSSL
ncbi:MAG: hypothetical protein IRZ31_20155 [Thermogemmatispora sp.]|uniref:hypothetical protein n=1 Tax=Thermogemmatispora sp. TaxID=1968838 RepID=UPI002616AA5A|nr:hypothetical protein [Thermogemmatispora sp.]MBX5459213.1 hypothetical protein [Thermogemmatispora sp.]